MRIYDPANEEGFARYLNGGHSESYSKKIKQLQDRTEISTS